MNLMSSKPEFPEETTRSSPMFFSGDSHSDPGSPAATGAVTVKEHMFYKVVTPSDVGKLNRLVVPKHHAEKYFPLDSSTNEKGLVLDFEDRNGKPWRFRYSYWNSSQSYVMTKGWSRFVKEKNLDAGDTVSFHRAGKNGRFFIDWSRRSDHPPRVYTPNHRLSFDRPNMIHPLYLHSNHYHPYCNNIVVVGNPCRPSSVVYPGLFPGASGGATAAFGAVPAVESKAEGKRLRLFGVNMDCSVSESDHQYDDDILPILSLDSSSSSVRSLQLRPYNSDNYNHSKGKGSISLDLDI